MTSYSNSRKIAAAIGVTLILASTSGAAQVMNAIVPFLLEGMNVSLTTFMIGPSIATLLSFGVSAVGIKIIDIITPKWCMLIGSVCCAFTMYIVGIATSFVLWIVANILNGVVLAFATYAAAGGVVANFYGEKTQRAFGLIGGLAALIVSGWAALTSTLLNVMPYQQLFAIYAVAIIVIGVVCNFVLIGKVPRVRLGAPKTDAASGKNEETAGFTFAELLKKGASIYCFLAAMFLVALCSSGVSSYASVYYTSFGMAATTAALMVSVYYFVSAILKLLSGVIVYKLGVKMSSRLIFLCYALGMACLLVWSQVQLLPLAVIGIALCAFISYGTMLPGLFIPELYGMKNYTGVNSAGMSGYYLGAVVVLFGLSIVIGFLGYFNSFLALAIVAIITLVLMTVASATSPMKKIDSDKEKA